MSLVSLKAAKNYLERAFVILNECDCVLDEEVRSVINDLQNVIEEFSDEPADY